VIIISRLAIKKLQDDVFALRIPIHGTGTYYHLLVSSDMRVALVSKIVSTSRRTPLPILFVEQSATTCFLAPEIGSLSARARRGYRTLVVTRDSLGHSVLVRIHE
jgi:hypothetical protein